MASALPGVPARNRGRSDPFSHRRKGDKATGQPVLVRVYFGFNDFGRVDVLWKTGFVPTTSVRNSALASPPALREEGKGGGANGDIGIDMKPRHYVTFVLHMSNEDPPSQ